jgi:hypothetical protein
MNRVTSGSGSGPRKAKRVELARSVATNLPRRLSAQTFQDIAMATAARVLGASDDWKWLITSLVMRRPSFPFLCSSKRPAARAPAIAT